MQRSLAGRLASASVFFGALIAIPGCASAEPVTCSYDLKRDATLAKMVAGDVWWTHSQIIQGQGTTRSDVLIDAAEDLGIDPRSIPTTWDQLEDTQLRLSELAGDLQSNEALDETAKQLLREASAEVRGLSSMITLGNLASKGPSINADLKVKQEETRDALDKFLERCSELDAQEER